MTAETLAAAAVTEELHVWEAGGAASPRRSPPGWAPRLAAHQAALAALLAVEGPRTPENSLRLYDAAIEQLALAGAQAGMLNSVAPDKAVRDQAQMEAQRVAMAASALSLNRAVYEALAAIDVDGADAATKHYVERTLLSYRLAGVDKDEATRDHLQALHEKATRLSLEFSRNIQEGAKTIEAAQSELDGLPADYLRGIQPDADGRVTDLHRSAGHAAGDDLCRKRGAARAHVPGLQHARLSGEPADTAGATAGHAAGDRDGARLSQLGRPGHGRPDDGLGGQCAHVSGEAE